MEPPVEVAGGPSQLVRCEGERDPRRELWHCAEATESQFGQRLGSRSEVTRLKRSGRPPPDPPPTRPKGRGSRNNVSVRIERSRENVFTVTATSQELSALVAGARMALEAMRAAPEPPPSEALEILERVLG